MVKYTTNLYGDRIEIIGNVILNLEYWDCECISQRYIHRISESSCSICRSIKDESPSSRENEVLIFVYD